ncbi:MAG: HAD hydrolase-like protein [Acidobacteria bacterium]|nr:HAD hydrolase-like protein [Acidobacteriota bacterium]
MPANGSTIFVDADDTLWENNVYFEAVVQAYARRLEARGCPPETARQTLLDIERVRTRVHGYGLRNFNLSLNEACRSLLGDDCLDELAEVDALCASIAAQDMALLPGVEATLETLRRRHRLIVLTKGDAADQASKVERSGLGPMFDAVEVVKEKDADTYRDVLDRYRVDPAGAWMVGNSPKSDVLPALAVGLGAVFIPHAATWALELERLPEAPHPRLLVLERFEDLIRHF